MHGRRQGLEDHADAALGDGALDAAVVDRLDPEERRLAIGERHFGPVLLGQGKGRLDGAVAAAHDKDAPAGVRARVEQAVRDLWQFLARQAELARCAATAEGETDMACADVLHVGVHDEVSVVHARQRPERLAAVDGQLLLLRDAVP